MFASRVSERTSGRIYVDYTVHTCSWGGHAAKETMKKFEMSQNAGMVRSSDLSRGMTLRNASENRRLVGHLQHLDLQLHNNLVNLQAEISELKLSHYRKRPKTSCTQGKTPIGKTWSDPRHVNARQVRSASARVSPLVVQGRNNDEISSKPFLPQISAQTALVGKRVDLPERPISPRSPTSARRLRSVPKNSTNHLSTTNITNLHRPKSTPNLNVSSAESNSDAPSNSRPVFRNVASQDQPHGKDATPLRSRSSGDLSASPIELNDRVSDFLKRPNTSSGEREKDGTNELKRTLSDVIPTINIEEEPHEMEENDESTNREGQEFLTDEELFRNSLLLKASRDDGFSRSLPDLTSLGFMDFNEVIDQRLRRLQEEIPSEKEMRKIRYLRFRDEPAPLKIKEIFDKENHHEQVLDKIDE